MTPERINSILAIIKRPLLLSQLVNARESLELYITHVLEDMRDDLAMQIMLETPRLDREDETLP